MRRENWWLFGEKAIGMRRSVLDLPRYLSGIRVGKRPTFAWQDPWTLPSDKAYVFPFSDDYVMGVLLSEVHVAWAWHQGATLKADLAYTSTSVFETFPWPYPVTDTQRDTVAELSRQIIARRREICADENFGLTKLYNLVDDGAYTDLKKLHKQLDEAVAACYGWPKSAAEDAPEIVRRLTALNKEISEGTRQYSPFD